MTSRDVYEGVLFELNKAHAPSLSTEEFVYLLNKAILAFTNERYNFYAVNQQLSDDLRVLLVEYTVNLVPNDIQIDIDGVRYITKDLGVTDYLHIQSCDLIVKNTISNLIKRYTAKRMTLDMYGAIYNNEYLKPALIRPYFLLLKADVLVPTTDQNNSKFKIFIGDDVANIVPSAVRMFYLKLPDTVTLTDDQVFNLDTDTSPTLEFPDYLKNEFVKRVAWYQIESTRDQRISTFPQLNQEILTVPLEFAGKGSSQQQSSQQS